MTFLTPRFTEQSLFPLSISASVLKARVTASTPLLQRQLLLSTSTKAGLSLTPIPGPFNPL